jgi:hypothetical protein
MTNDTSTTTRPTSLSTVLERIEDGAESPPGVPR